MSDYEPIVTIGQLGIQQLKKSTIIYSPIQQKINMPTNVFSLSFSSPVTFAAFESHLPSLELWLDLGCGGGCFKTICLAPRKGNPRPRLQTIRINQQAIHWMNIRPSHVRLLSPTVSNP